MKTIMLTIMLATALTAPAVGQIDDSRMLYCSVTLSEEGRARDTYILRAVLAHAKDAGITVMLWTAPAL